MDIHTFGAPGKQVRSMAFDASFNGCSIIGSDENFEHEKIWRVALLAFEIRARGELARFEVLFLRKILDAFDPCSPWRKG